ncbi:MAG: DUF6114 domain-containing protein [Candidatus Micrarchaeaceae archaeon]
MNKLKVAAILFLVSGILVVADALLSYYSVSYLESVLQKPNLSAAINTSAINQSTITELRSLGPTLLGLSLIGVASGAVLLAVAYMISKSPQRAKTFAIVGIVFSLISLSGNGGFIIGMVLGIVAGVVALIK